MNWKGSALALTTALVFTVVPVALTAASTAPPIPNPLTTHIVCPLAQIRSEVVTPLPSGWWMTPMIDNLKETSVSILSGKPTLYCRYGGAGFIMHLAPLGTVCHSVSDGFICTRLIKLP